MESIDDDAADFQFSIKLVKMDDKQEAEVNYLLEYDQPGGHMTSANLAGSPRYRLQVYMGIVKRNNVKAKFRFHV